MPVFASQRELSTGMIERACIKTRRLPIRRRVTGATVVAKAALVNVFVASATAR